MTLATKPFFEVHFTPRQPLRLQKIHKSTIDLQNLGTLKNEETKPAFPPFFRPKHAIPQPLPTPAPCSTMKPIFMIFRTRKFCPVGSKTWTAKREPAARKLSHKCRFSRFGQVLIRRSRIVTCS